MQMENTETCWVFPAVHCTTPLGTSDINLPTCTRHSWISFILGVMIMFGIFKTAFKCNNGTPSIIENDNNGVTSKNLNISNSYFKGWAVQGLGGIVL